MYDAITRIEEYTTNMKEAEFLYSNLVQAAVIREIEIIGEATKMISKNLKEKYPSIPWKSIIGMRDKLIHHYFGVDIPAVWKTVQEDIPVLKKEIAQIIKNIEKK